MDQPPVVMSAVNPRFLPPSATFGDPSHLPFYRSSYGMDAHTVTMRIEIVADCRLCGRIDSENLICPNSHHDPIAAPPSLSSQPHQYHPVQQTAPTPPTNLHHWQASGIPMTGPLFSHHWPISYVTQNDTNSSPTIPQFSPTRSAPATSNHIQPTVPHIYARYPETHQELQQHPPHQQSASETIIPQYPLSTHSAPANNAGISLTVPMSDMAYVQRRFQEAHRESICLHPQPLHQQSNQHLIQSGDAMEAEVVNAMTPVYNAYRQGNTNAPSEHGHFPR